MIPIIIGVTGLPSAGKGVFCDIARNHYGFKQIVMGDVIRRECKKRGLPVTRESSNIVMIELRKERGANAIALVTLEWIDNLIQKDVKLILIDGIRSLSEVETFTASYENFTLIAVHASQQTRLHRAMNRRRKDDAFSKEAFLERDKIELDIGIGDVVAKSEILISSETSISKTKKQFKEALEFILKQNKIEIEV
ncbi:MAG: Adenylate kinase [Candidatus Heimdallarchaeota archaeon LC_2]|nr:MAG: Adenylate kinase [Candidatus Heimdallarchaeota archaeon LC_2]